MNLFTYYWIGVNYIDDELKTIFGWLLDILQCTKERRIDMTELESFLESSSISGLNHISATRRYGRLFWVFVVLTGFTLSGFLIYESFQAWEESPVKTTIETLSITELRFPKVTVCPPKNTYTNLNYDLMMNKDKTLDDSTRMELTKYALELLHSNLYDKAMRNLSKLQETDRYHKWYHDLIAVELPFPNNELSITNFAPSGSIYTQHFGEQFKFQNVVSDSVYWINLNTPENYIGNNNVTLHIAIEKISMKDLSSGYDKFRFDSVFLDPELTIYTKNFTPPPTYIPMIRTKRKVSKVDIKNLDMKLMPGFNITWYYSGNSGPLDEPVVRKKARTVNKLFIRDVSFAFYF